MYILFTHTCNIYIYICHTNNAACCNCLNQLLHHVNKQHCNINCCSYVPAGRVDRGMSGPALRPISLLRSSLLRFADSDFPGNHTGLGVPPRNIKIMLESNPLKSRVLVRRLEVLGIWCFLLRPRMKVLHGRAPICPLRKRDHCIGVCIGYAFGMHQACIGVRIKWSPFLSNWVVVVLVHAHIVCIYWNGNYMKYCYSGRTSYDMCNYMKYCN